MAWHAMYYIKVYSSTYSIFINAYSGVLYTRAPIRNEINQCQFGVSRLFVTGHSIYALKFGAGQKTTSAMARWHWLDGRP